MVEQGFLGGFRCGHIEDHDGVVLFLIISQVSPENALNGGDDGDGDRR